MAVSTEQVRAYIGASEEELTEVARVQQVALSLVDDFTGDSDIPQFVIDQAVLDVSLAVWSRRDTVNGAVGLSFEGSVVFTPNDPMSKAYKMLRHYVLPF